MSRSARPRAAESSRREKRESAHPGFWMRSVQFAGLHRILHCVAEFAGEVRVAELNRLILRRRVYSTERGEPSKTTLYHCRNTLLQLGALERRGNSLSVARRNRHVAALLAETPCQGRALTRGASEAFGELVLRNSDCHQSFFRFFLRHPRPASVTNFRTSARSVVWNTIDDASVETSPLTQETSSAHRPSNRGRRKYWPVELRSVSTKEAVLLRAPIQIQAIMYGVRDWATKQLGLLDEFFDAGRGHVLFPVRHDEETGTDAAIAAILAVPTNGTEWTTVSVRDLLCDFCEVQGYTVGTLFRGIREFVRANVGHVSLISTIPNFAAITATSRKAADFELETAFRDSHGRLVSHVRFHNTVRDRYNGQEKAAAKAGNQQ